MEMLTVLICVVVTLWILWRWRITSTFKRLGIPGPPPNLLFGNLLELYYKNPIKCHQDWVKKYGRVVGYYVGMTPTILVTDPLILKDIFIKDFPKFMNREAGNPLVNKYDPHDKRSQSIIRLPGEAWKSVRSTLTPTFTTAKMKQMSGSMEASFEIMMGKLNDFADRQHEFDIFDVFQRVTLDVITRTAFGIKTDVQTNKNPKILRAAKIAFMGPFRSPLAFIGMSFPLLRAVCLKIQLLVSIIMFKGRNPFDAIRNGISRVLDLRRKNPQGRGTDLLQLMIDSAVQETGHVDLSQLEAGNTENEIKFKKQEQSSKTTKRMTDPEIISSSFVVLLAGYETTSTALAYTAYYLAKHQDIQERLFQEVDDIIQNNQKLEYATVNKLDYLDNVFCESLRMMPPVNLFTSRYALADVQYGDIKIPKGMIIKTNTYLSHHDPEFWENPEKFDPERFENKQNVNGITYFPFGVGPRNCLGMRFAQLEAKLVLAYVVHNFKIYLSEKNKESLPVQERMITLTPHKGVFVKLEKRTNI